MVVYHDDPNKLTSGGGSSGCRGGTLEIPQCRDTYSDGGDGGDGEKMQSRGSSLSYKVLLALSVFAVLVAGGRGLYSHGSSQGEGNRDGSSGGTISGSGPVKAGVRGQRTLAWGKTKSHDTSSSPKDDEAVTVGSTPNGGGDEEPSQEKPVSKYEAVYIPPEQIEEEEPELALPPEQIIEEHIIHKVPGSAAQAPKREHKVSALVPKKEPAHVYVSPEEKEKMAEEVATQQEEEEKPAAGPRQPLIREGICEDDPTYVMSNLKNCASWISRVGRVALHNGRCNQYTGVHDEYGDELQIKHFCRLSCGMCGDAWNAPEEVPSNETPANTNVNPYAAELDEMKDEEEEEFAEELEEMEVKGEVMIDKEEEEEGMSEEEKEEFEEEEEVQDEIEEEEQTEEDVTLWEEEEETENEEEEEEVEEGGVEIVEPADEDEEDTFDVEEETTELDFFIPLTALEREALKERLRNTLLVTKNSLMAMSLNSEEYTIQHQRTLTLSVDNPKQFMHLQNNQTGSDGIDGLIQCAVGRQNDMQGDEDAIIPQSISESTNLDTCLDELAGLLDSTYKDGGFYLNTEEGLKFDPADEKLGIPEDKKNACNAGYTDVMSYGASLNAVRAFGWKDVDSIAMFANPLERVHRMYRLTAKSCYHCRGLPTVLKQIERGLFGKEVGEDADTSYDHDDFCAVQMIGHQGTNLLTNPDLLDVANDVSFPNEKEIVEEAVRNLREDITWIGLLDQMGQSVDGFQEVFPWLSTNLNGEAVMLQREFGEMDEKLGADVNFGMPPTYKDEQSCSVQDQDEEPEYICGTREIGGDALALIKRLNTRDMAVYKAAQERFLLQQEVIGEFRSTTEFNGNR